MRQTVIWGAGQNGMRLAGSIPACAFFIDNDPRKDGDMCVGLPVVHSSRIKDFHDFYIVISPSDPGEIKKQLKSYGLEEGKDFSQAEEYYQDIVPIRLVNRTIFSLCFPDGAEASEYEIEEIFSSGEEYFKIREMHSGFLKYEEVLEDLYGALKGKKGIYSGYCPVCGKDVDFSLTYYFEADGRPIWRESGVCPECKCNSRMRYMVERIRSKKVTGTVYVNEFVTPFYKALRNYVDPLVGSEYMGADMPPGSYVDGIRHEDAMNLSFEDGSLGMIVSNDVYEHVADYEQAFKEAYRCLKRGGHFLFSVPINALKEKTSARARLMENGDIEYLQEPVFHGNPLSAKGSLVFHDFGWNIIERLKESGFTHAHFVCYASARKAYFGNLPMIVEAVKM